jgi:cytoskeletal protein RodZ
LEWEDRIFSTGTIWRETDWSKSGQLSLEGGKLPVCTLNNLNPQQGENGKRNVISIRVWVLLGLTALFFLVALFAALFVVAKSFQNREIATVRPLASASSEASPAGPQSSPAETPTPPASGNSPPPQGSSSNTPLESPTASPDSASPGPSPEPSSPTPTPDSSPSASDSTGSEMPAPSPASQAAPPPVVSNAKEEDTTRREVLKRIDMIRELTPKEKD